MSMYIVARFKDNEREYRWHVGKFNPVPSQDVCRVIEVQADGDELDYLSARFPFVLNNRPQENLNGSWQSVRIVKWYGDDARFIVGNLT